VVELKSTEPGPSLLIVDDDEDIAEMLTAYFNGQGYSIQVAYLGEDALKACRTNHPDLIILDIRLPDIDGFEVARQLRANQRTQDIPIIFLTDQRERASRLQGLELGADDYITKPYDIQELRLRVRNSLRRTSEGPLTNPVTGLPEGVLVEERLRECLRNQDWRMLIVSIEHMDEFSESYGFVASDDVQRAVSLMIHNAIRGLGSPNDFFGQLGPTDFVLLVHPKDLPAIEERIRGRLEQSLDYFYPLKDRDTTVSNQNRLSLRIKRLSPSDGPFKDLASIQAKLMRLLGG